MRCIVDRRRLLSNTTPQKPASPFTLLVVAVEGEFLQTAGPTGRWARPRTQPDDRTLHMRGSADQLPYTATQ